MTSLLQHVFMGIIRLETCYKGFVPWVSVWFFRTCAGLSGVMLLEAAKLFGLETDDLECSVLMG